MKTILKLGIPGLMLLGVAGCSMLGVGDSKFKCEEEECKSVREAYRDRYSERWDGKVGDTPYKDADEKKGDFFVDYRDGDEWNNGVPQKVVVVEKTLTQNEVASLQKVDHTFVREQGAILSTYIMPWTDGGKTAHLGREMVTEIEPRKWKVSEITTRNKNKIIPAKLRSQAQGQ